MWQLCGALSRKELAVLNPQEGHIIRYGLAGGPHVFTYIYRKVMALNEIEGRYLQTVVVYMIVCFVYFCLTL